MRQAVKGFLATISLLCIVSFSAFAQTADDSFDIDDFRELAMRAENVVSNDRASTEALEILRTDLANSRRKALNAQKPVVQRVENTQKQIDVLGPAPEGDQTEPDGIALRRTELSEQLAKVRAPLISAQVAHRRASGLIEEINKIIRDRQRDKFFHLEKTPLNPLGWPVALAALSKHTKKITAEVRAHRASIISKKVRKQRRPIILIVLALFMKRVHKRLSACKQ